MDKNSADFKVFLRFLDEMGWQIAIPAGGGEEDDGELHGMVIGEEAYVNYILKHLE